VLRFFGRRKAVQPQAVDRSSGRMAIRDEFADIASHISTTKPIIVDGGANRGDVTQRFLERHPGAVIYAFEPHPGLIRALHERFGRNQSITIFPYALGSTSGVRTFNILNHDPSSSLLKPTETNFKYHKEMMQTAQEVDVQVRRLDDLVEHVEIDVIKLDLQGFELEALKGSEKILPSTKIIVTEVEFVPLYEDQALFGDVDVYLRMHGFSLLNLYDLYTHEDGQLTSGDAVYLNDGYFQRQSAEL
jgi:FkbM family methyltransferase